MLIEKPIQANDIVTIKLITNEEIIAKLISQDERNVIVQKVLLMNLSVDHQTGRPSIQMMPFFTLGGNSDAKITLRKDHIIVLTPSNEEAASGYIHNTSGLVTPSKSGLVV